MVSLSVDLSGLVAQQQADPSDYITPLNELREYLENAANGIQPFDGLLGGSGSLESSALAEFDSTTKGILLPRMTLSQRDAIAAAAEGLMLWNSTDKQFSRHNGASWANVEASPSRFVQLVAPTTFSAVSSVTINGISQDYQDLLLCVKCRSASTYTGDKFLLRFNNQSDASDYAWNIFYGTTTIFNENDAADSEIEILNTGGIAGASRYSNYNIWIRNYTEPSTRIVGDFSGSYAPSSGVQACWGSFEWLNGGAINRIDILKMNDPNVSSISGSYALYGLGT